MNVSFYLYSGIISAIYSVYAGLNYYTYSGIDLLESKKAKKMIKNREIDTIIDIRTKLEWNNGHYPNAIHIPVTSINKKTTKKISKKSKILVYCNTGQRARRAAKKLRDLGYENVYYIAGTYTTIL